MEAVGFNEVAPQCHSTGCTNPAPNKCAGCKVVRYCSKVCQRAHWPTHKPICKKGEGSGDVHETGGVINNAVRILLGHFSDRESLRQLVKPFRLESRRQENRDERRNGEKLCSGSGGARWWTGGSATTTRARIRGIYINPAPRTGTARNGVVELVTERRAEHSHESFVRHGHGPVHGEAIWIRSGPKGDITPEEILVDDVVNTILYYQKHAPLTVWHQRESSRCIRKTSAKMGVDPKELHSLW